MLDTEVRYGTKQTCSSFQEMYSLMWQRDNLIVQKCIIVVSAVKKRPREILARVDNDHSAWRSIVFRLWCWYALASAAGAEPPGAAVRVWTRELSVVLGTWTVIVSLSPFPGANKCQLNYLFILPKWIHYFNSRSSGQSIVKMKNFVLSVFILILTRSSWCAGRIWLLASIMLVYLTISKDSGNYPVVFV